MKRDESFEETNPGSVEMLGFPGTTPLAFLAHGGMQGHAAQPSASSGIQYGSSLS